MVKIFSLAVVSGMLGTGLSSDSQPSGCGTSRGQKIDVTGHKMGDGGGKQRRKTFNTTESYFFTFFCCIFVNSFTFFGL